MHEELDRKPGWKEGVMLLGAAACMLAILAGVFALGHYILVPLLQQAMNGFIALARMGIS